jgi:succinate-semialdehyde dehydrogenase/glutarate-semialdehyde dehydrogenase
MTTVHNADRLADLRLANIDVQMYVDGKWLWRDATFAVRDPATLNVVASVPEATEEDTASAVASAAAAFKGWRSWLPDERRRLLNDIARLIERDVEHLAGLVTLETGKPIGEARHEVLYARDFADWYAEEARRICGYTFRAGNRPDVRLSVTRYPLGVVVALVPWNYPVVLLCRKLFAAMAAGNTVVVKPSEKTPIASGYLMRLVEEAGTPPGVVNYITAGQPQQMGAQLLADKRVAHVSFTGSVATGKVLARQAADNLVRLSLELGGHNPFLVLRDCDVAAAAEAAAHARLRNGGQTCVSPNRVYVERPVYEEFVGVYVNKLQAAVVGDGFDAGTTIGPMIDGPAFDKVERHIADAVSQGAELRCGGGSLTPRPDCKGYFVAPAVLTSVSPTMLVLQEETFGPVAPVVAFDQLDDVIEWANTSDYGLAAYVYTDNLGSAIRLTDELEAGMVVVNQATGSGVQAPQGGIKQSGFGLEGGREGLEEFTYQKYVSLAG